MASIGNISRRDFMNGVALTVTAGSYLSPMDLFAKSTANYPPALTGLRGSHAGSFEIAHTVSMGGNRFETPTHRTDDEYDLVIAGGGISGLSAALLYQQRAGHDKKILILDNHDDFGGHAKRNEFTVDGRNLISYGGSQSLEAPSKYSPVSARLLKDVGIDTDPFYEYFDQNFFRSRGLGRGLYFGSEQYGKDVLCPNIFRAYNGGSDLSTLEAEVATFPVSDEAKAALIQLIGGFS